MSWKNLKTFAIITLLVMDIVFAFFVIERQYSVSYYDDTLIDSAITVFSEGGLHIDRSFLEMKKKMPSVYTGKIQTELFSEVTAAMERDGYQIEEDTGCLRFTGENGEFFFGNDFIFHFKAPVIRTILFNCEEIRCIVVPFDDGGIADQKIRFKHIRI